MKETVGNTHMTTLPRTIRVTNAGGTIEIFRCPDGSIEVSAVDANNDALTAVLGEPEIKAQLVLEAQGA